MPSARAFVLSGGTEDAVDSVDGIATFFADPDGSIRRIEISDERAIKQSKAPASFSVELPAQSGLQFELPSALNSPVLSQIGEQLKALEGIALLQGHEPAEFSRIHPDPPFSQLRALGDGGFIQFSRDLQRANLLEWISGQDRRDAPPYVLMLLGVR